MKRILITGMSGTGKSTVIEQLAALGHRAVDLDTPAYSHMVTVDPGELTGIGLGRDWVWREDRTRKVLSSSDADVLFVAGCSPNQGRFYPEFDAVILFSAPLDVIADRLATRTNNPFGQRPGEVERVLRLREEVEPLLRRGASHEIDTSAPLDEVVARVIRIAGIAP